MLGGALDQDELGLARGEPEAALVAWVLDPEPTYRERRDAGHMRRRHRGALEVCVVPAGAPVAVLLDARARAGRRDVAGRVDQAVILEEAQRIRRQDLVADR